MSRPRLEATPILRRGPDEVDTFKGMSTTLMTSAAFRRVKPSHLKLYLDVIARHNGFNNGRIVLGSRDAAASTGLSRPTVLNAFDQLEKLGLLICRVKGEMLLDDNGKFSAASERFASEWEVTDYHTWSGDDPVEAKRTYADWSDEAGAIVPGSRSEELPKPRMPKPKQRTAPTKSASATRVPSKPIRSSALKRPASAAPAKPAPSAPSRSQRSEPTIPEPASAAPQRKPNDRTYSLDDILRDDERFLARTGKPRPPTQSRPDGKWWHLGKPITTEQAMAMEAADVPF